MAIEFRCPQCSATLRTPDDSAGKLTACPQCKAELTIPATSQPATSQPGDLFAGLPSSRPAAAGTPAGEFNPYAAPTQSLQGPAMPTGVQGNLDIADVFTRTRKIVEGHLGLLVVTMIILVIIGWVNFGIQTGIQVLFKDSVAGGVLAFAVGTALGVFFQAGTADMMLKLASGKPADIVNLFQGGKWYLPSLGATLLFQLAIFLGSLACAVPGIILLTILWPFQYLIVDRDMGAIDALNATFELTKGQRLNFFACFLVLGLGAVLVCCTCVGVIVAGPFLMLMMPVMYLILSGQPTADQVTYSQTNTFR